MTTLQRRKRLRHAPLAAMMLAGSVCAIAQTRPDQSRQTMPPASAPNTQERVASLGLSVPMPISDRECRRYSQILRLSPEQNAALMSAWAKYSQQWQKIEGEQLPRVEALARDGLKSLETNGNSRTSLAAHDLFDDAEGRLIEEQERLDTQLFEELLPLLTEDQVGCLPRAHLHRERYRCHALYVFLDLPSAIIDLSQLVEAADLPAEQMEAVDPVLLEYELVVTQPLSRLRKTEKERARKQCLLLQELIFDEFDQRRDVAAPDYRARKQAFWEEWQRSLRPRAQLQRQIANANRRFLPRILEQLPENVRKTVGHEFTVRAYPYVHPDPLDPAEVFEHIIKSEGLDQDHRAALQAMWEGYRQAYQSLCTKMEDASDDRQEEFARTHTNDDREEFRQRMRALRDERWLRSRQFVEQVESILPAEVLNEVMPRIKDYKSEADRYERFAANDSYPT